MNEGEAAGVVERGEVVKVWIQRGEAVAEADGVGLESAGIVALAGGGVVEHRGILGQADGLPEGRITRVLDRDDVVDSVIAAAQEDEEQLFAADADVDL